MTNTHVIEQLCSMIRTDVIACFQLNKDASTIEISHIKLIQLTSFIIYLKSLFPLSINTPVAKFKKECFLID